MTPQPETAAMSGAETEAGKEPPSASSQPPDVPAAPDRDLGEPDRDLGEPEKPQYSVANILQAGRRAEGSGHRDYAIQFYTHLVDHHPETPEGMEARGSLERLTGAGVRPAKEAKRNATLLAQAAAPLVFKEPEAPSRNESLARLSYREAPPPAVETEAMAQLLPAPHMNYRLGKFLARVLAGFGLFLVVAGLVIPLLAVAGQRLGPLSMDVSGAPLALLLAPFALALGIGMMVASQAAFAVFEQAEGLRQLRKMERALRDGKA